MPVLSHIRPEPQRPAAARGFERTHRYWDPQQQRWIAKVLPGEYYVTRHDEAITTVLGSCVAACVRDPELGVGGMNHFMLPEESADPRNDRWLHPQLRLATRYGSYAMESLVNALLKLGAARHRLEIKLFGGGRILTTMTDVGARNIEFVRNYLRLEGYRVAAEDLGDEHPRKIVYFPVTGLVRVKRLPLVRNAVVADRERRYLASLGDRAVDGGVELFD